MGISTEFSGIVSAFSENKEAIIDHYWMFRITPEQKMMNAAITGSNSSDLAGSIHCCCIFWFCLRCIPYVAFDVEM
jgi:hypothetical protein